jgi:hypothetical protein
MLQYQITRSRTRKPMQVVFLKIAQPTQKAAVLSHIIRKSMHVIQPMQKAACTTSDRTYTSRVKAEMPAGMVPENWLLATESSLQRS